MTHKKKKSKIKRLTLVLLQNPSSPTFVLKLPQAEPRKQAYSPSVYPPVSSSHIPFQAV